MRSAALSSRRRVRSVRRSSARGSVAVMLRNPLWALRVCGANKKPSAVGHWACKEILHRAVAKANDLDPRDQVGLLTGPWAFRYGADLHAGPGIALPGSLFRVKAKCKLPLSARQRTSAV